MAFGSGNVVAAKDRDRMDMTMASRSLLAMLSVYFRPELLRGFNPDLMFKTLIQKVKGSLGGSFDYDVFLGDMVDKLTDDLHDAEQEQKIITGLKGYMRHLVKEVGLSEEEEDVLFDVHGRMSDELRDRMRGIGGKLRGVLGAYFSKYFWFQARNWIQKDRPESLERMQEERGKEPIPREEREDEGMEDPEPSSDVGYTPEEYRTLEDMERMQGQEVKVKKVMDYIKTAPMDAGRRSIYEKIISDMYLGGSKTQVEVAKDLGISKGMLSKHHRALLDMLRDFFRGGSSSVPGGVSEDVLKQEETIEEKVPLYTEVLRDSAARASFEDYYKLESRRKPFKDKTQRIMELLAAGKSRKDVIQETGYPEAVVRSVKWHYFDDQYKKWYKGYMMRKMVSYLRALAASWSVSERVGGYIPSGKGKTPVQVRKRYEVLKGGSPEWHRIWEDLVKLSEGDDSNDMAKDYPGWGTGDFEALLKLIEEEVGSFGAEPLETGGDKDLTGIEARALKAFKAGQFTIHIQFTSSFDNENVARYPQILEDAKKLDPENPAHFAYMNYVLDFDYINRKPKSPSTPNTVEVTYERALNSDGSGKAPAIQVRLRQMKVKDNKNEYVDEKVGRGHPFVDKVYAYIQEHIWSEGMIPHSHFTVEYLWSDPVDKPAGWKDYIPKSRRKVLGIERFVRLYRGLGSDDAVHKDRKFVDDETQLIRKERKMGPRKEDFVVVEKLQAKLFGLSKLLKEERGKSRIKQDAKRISELEREIAGIKDAIKSHRPKEQEDLLDFLTHEHVREHSVEESKVTDVPVGKVVQGSGGSPVYEKEVHEEHKARAFAGPQDSKVALLMGRFKYYGMDDLHINYHKWLEPDDLLTLARELLTRAKDFHDKVVAGADANAVRDAETKYNTLIGTAERPGLAFEGFAAFPHDLYMRREKFKEDYPEDYKAFAVGKDMDWVTAPVRKETISKIEGMFSKAILKLPEGRRLPEAQDEKAKKFEGLLNTYRVKIPKWYSSAEMVTQARAIHRSIVTALKEDLKGLKGKGKEERAAELNKKYQGDLEVAGDTYSAYVKDLRSRRDMFLRDQPDHAKTYFRDQDTDWVDDSDTVAKVISEGTEAIRKGYELQKDLHQKSTQMVDVGVFEGLEAHLHHIQNGVGRLGTKFTKARMEHVAPDEVVSAIKGTRQEVREGFDTLNAELQDLERKAKVSEDGTLEKILQDIADIRKVLPGKAAELMAIIEKESAVSNKPAAGAAVALLGHTEYFTSLYNLLHSYLWFRTPKVVRAGTMQDELQDVAKKYDSAAKLQVLKKHIHDVTPDATERGVYDKILADIILGHKQPWEVASELKMDVKDVGYHESKLMDVIRDFEAVPETSLLEQKQEHRFKDTDSLDGKRAKIGVLADQVAGSQNLRSEATHRKVSNLANTMKTLLKKFIAEVPVGNLGVTMFKDKPGPGGIVQRDPRRRTEVKPVHTPGLTVREIKASLADTIRELSTYPTMDALKAFSVVMSADDREKAIVDFVLPDYMVQEAKKTIQKLKSNEHEEIKSQADKAQEQLRMILDLLVSTFKQGLTVDEINRLMDSDPNLAEKARREKVPPKTLVMVRLKKDADIFARTMIKDFMDKWDPISTMSMPYPKEEGKKPKVKVYPVLESFIEHHESGMLKGLSSLVPPQEDKVEAPGMKSSEEIWKSIERFFHLEDEKELSKKYKWELDETSGGGGGKGKSGPSKGTVNERGEFVPLKIPPAEGTWQELLHTMIGILKEGVPERVKEHNKTLPGTPNKPSEDKPLTPTNMKIEEEAEYFVKVMLYHRLARIRKTIQDGTYINVQDIVEDLVSFLKISVPGILKRISFEPYKAQKQKGIPAISLTSLDDAKEMYAKFEAILKHINKYIAPDSLDKVSDIAPPRLLQIAETGGKGSLLPTRSEMKQASTRDMTMRIAHNSLLIPDSSILSESELILR
jgi:DNA-binding CsgD family transcriptional regulator